MAGDPLTAAHLQDYVDCAYRFWLRHVERVESPSVQAEPQVEHEAAVERAAAFHRLAQQLVLGVSASVLETSIADERVRGWWKQLVATGLSDLPPRRFADVTLVAPLADTQIAATIDLLAIEPGRVVVVDLKTTGKTALNSIKARMRTKVTRWVVSQAAGAMMGATVSPDDVELRYWFAEDEVPLVSLPYSQKQKAADERELKALVKRIRKEREFAKTDDLTTCSICAYRAIARPEVRPSPVAMIDDDYFVAAGASNDVDG